MVLMVTGADVTVIALKDWPNGWLLDSTAKHLMGVGGVSNTHQSKYMLTTKSHEGSPYHVLPYAAPIPVKVET